jgi:hypothetical protein
MQPKVFLFGFGDKLYLDFGFGLALLPFVPGAKGVESEARGKDFASGSRQYEGRQARDVRDFPQRLCQTPVRGGYIAH